MPFEACLGIVFPHVRTQRIILVDNHCCSKLASGWVLRIPFSDTPRTFLRQIQHFRGDHVPQRYDKNNPLMTSAAILLGSEEAAHELGGDLAASLQYSGLSRGQIATGEDFVPLHKVVTFLNHAADSLGCEHFGLLVAKHQPPVRFAMLGQLVRFSPDLEQAITDAIRFSILNSQYSIWCIERNEQTMTLIRQVRGHLDMGLSQLQTLALAVTYKAMSAVCQRKVALSQVVFSHGSPVSHDKVKAFFGAPVLFDQPFNGLVIPNAELATRIPTADAQVRGLLSAHLEELALGNAAELDVVERLRRELRRTVGSRHCTLEGVCQSWGTHPRGLQRSLRERGTSFRDLLSDVRQELAEEYLRNSSVAVLELADLLGYRNASAFSRAFKQRTGVAPDYWRARQAT
jgi:AraC-like DNA-binding protein